MAVMKARVIRSKKNIFFILLLLGFLAGKSFAAVSGYDRTTSEKTGADTTNLTLDEVVNLALRNNRSIKDQEFAVKSSRVNLGASRNTFDVKLNRYQVLITLPRMKMK